MYVAKRRFQQLCPQVLPSMIRWLVKVLGYLRGLVERYLVNL